MRKLIPLWAVLLSGCVGQTDYIVAQEAAKVRSLEIGMSVTEVERIMGTDMMYLGGGRPEARPIRVDKFQNKEGKRITVYFYRSSIKDNDGVCTDDETTAVVFVDGKVDALLPGEKSKEVIEVRFR